MNRNWKIQVDFRESQPTIEALEHFGAPTALTRLELGDFATDYLLIEHKTMLDFAASMIDGRLWKQCDRMLNDQRAKWLVVDGQLEDLEDRFSREQIVGAMSSCSVRYPINVTWLPDIAAAMYFVWKVCEKAEEGKLMAPRTIYLRQKQAVRDTRVRAIKTMYSLPLRLAGGLLRHFGTVRSVVNASEEELQQVPGIGEVRAQRMVHLVTSKIQSDEA